VVLIGPIAIALAGLLALVLGTTVLMHSHNGIIVLVLVVGALLYLGYRTWEWSEDYFVVTWTVPGQRGVHPQDSDDAAGQGHDMSFSAHPRPHAGLRAVHPESAGQDRPLHHRPCPPASSSTSRSAP
jgi:hypothetical protein